MPRNKRSTYEELNLNEIVQMWSQDALKESHPRIRDRGQIDHLCDFSAVEFVDLPPEYQYIQGKPQSEIMYESVFRNNTDREQSFTFNAVKEATSVTKIDINRALVVDGKTRLKMSCLPKVLPKAPGFENNISVKEIGGQEYKEKLTGVLDTYATVSQNSTTKATLLIEEINYKGRFTVATDIQGQVSVDVADTDRDQLITTYVGDISSILVQYYGVVPGKPRPRHIVGPVFESKGFCSFRVGIKYNVILNDE